MIRVNNKEIDDAKVVIEMQYHSSDSHTNAKNKASEALIIAELIQQRAEELGLDSAELETNDESLNALIKREIDVPKASDEACRTYFENNPDKFKTSPLVSGRHILISAPPEDARARSEALEQAKLIIRELQGDIQLFPKLAEQYSRCPSAKTGGHLGQISKGQTVPEFERQLFNCKEGLAEAPIESRYGVHVVDVDYKDEGKPLPYDMVRERISSYLNEKVRRKAIAHYIENLIANADIDGFDFSVSESPLLQ